MADAQDRGWGAPCAGGRTTLVRADGLRLPVRTELADLVAMLLDLTELGHGYDVLPGQTWGNACRYISGTTVWSNHAWGLAVDINAPSNPYASTAWHQRNARGPWPGLVCNMPRAMVEMWEAHGFRWGGRYATKPDPMHFEFMGTPATCRAITARLRDFLAGSGQPAPPPPAPAPTPAPPADQEYRMDTLDFTKVTADRSTYVTGRHVDNAQALMVSVLAWGGRGELVGALLALPYPVPDGKGGPGTAKALEVCQDILRFIGALDQPQSDRVLGPKTWRALIEF